MATTLCTLDKIEVITVMFGFGYHGAVDVEGMERDDTWEHSSELDKRIYACHNCGEYFDGKDTFAICRAHLGGGTEQSTSDLTMKLPAW